MGHAIGDAEFVGAPRASGPDLGCGSTTDDPAGLQERRGERLLTAQLDDDAVAADGSRHLGSESLGADVAVKVLVDDEAGEVGAVGTLQPTHVVLLVIGSCMVPPFGC